MRPDAAATADGPFTELDARRLGRVRRFFVRHPVVMDVVVALWYGVPAILAALVLAVGVDEPSAPMRGGVHIGVAVVGALVLLRRRHEPILTVAALVVLATVSLAVTGESGGVEFALALAMYAVATAKRPAVTWIVEAGMVLVTGALYAWLLDEATSGPALTRPEAFASAVTFSLVSSLVAIAIGVSVRGRRQHIDSLIQRANALAHDREQQAVIAVAEERARIARELHDVVAHSITVMVALADGARAAGARDPEGAARALDALSDTGRSALDDMRRVLGVLRDPHDDAPLVPEPEADLDELVERFRATGLPVRIVRTGALDDAPLAVRRSLHRIAQESLTNVLRHAPAVSSVLVEVSRVADGAGDRVELRVTDDATGAPGRDPVAVPGAGRGIIGMRERAASLGGTVEAGPHGRGWLVAAVLPIDAEGER